MPELSVILPVRNGEQTIATAIRSTLRAMPKDAELVVLNDASTDLTGEMVARIPDTRLRLLHQQPGLGVAKGLNHLLAATDSRWVARMDGDDYCLPWRFQYQLRMAKRQRLDGCFTPVIDWLSPAFKFRPHLSPGISAAAMPIQLLIANPISHPTALLRREAVEQVGGYREVPAEDFDLWLRMAIAGQRLVKLPLPTLLYRIHPSQITASTDWRTASWRNEAVNACYSLLAEQVCGQPLPRLVSLVTADLDPAEAGLTLEKAARLITDASNKLPTRQARLVQRRLQERLAFLRAKLVEAHQVF